MITVTYLKIAFITLLFPFLSTESKVTVVNFDQLQTYAAHKTDDSLYVVNFWATWCEPCVKELPAFQQIQAKDAGQKVKFIYVSLNSPRELVKVQSFVDDHKLNGTVLLLNSSNPNEWINRVDDSWSGTIPATVIYKLGKKVYFREGEFTPESLEKVIQSKNKQP